MKDQLDLGLLCTCPACRCSYCEGAVPCLCVGPGEQRLHWYHHCETCAPVEYPWRDFP